MRTQHVEISRLAPDRAGVTLTGEPDALAVVDTGRDLDLESPLLKHAAGALAARARVLDDAPRPAAARASLAADELAEPRPRDVLEASGAAAFIAGYCRLARLHAASSTLLAGARDLHGNLALHAARRFLEVDRDLSRDVGAAASTRARGDAEDVLSEERGEDVGEVAEVERRRAEAATLETGMAESVVKAAGLGLREHLVRRDRFAEALLGVGLGRDVRVQFPREPAERSLDLGIARRPADTEDLVVVTPDRRHCLKG